MPVRKFRFYIRLNEAISPDPFEPRRRRRLRTPCCLQGSYRLRCSVCWKSEMKSCPTTVSIFRCDCAAMRLDDRTYDRKPHPQSFGLRGEKLVEHSPGYFRRNTEPVIAHARANRSLTVSLGNDHDFTLVDRYIAHGVKRINNQIRQDLLQLNWIAFNR